MKTAIFLCVLVAFVAAEQQRDGAWQSNMEYRYKVQTQTLAAIPNLKNQWVGLYTKADLTIRPLSKDVLIAKMQNAQYGEWHDELPNGPTHQPKKEISYQPMEINAQPFEIRLNDGAIHSIAVEKDMTNVQLNQLKSIVSQLQVDIRARNLITDKHNHLPHNHNGHNKPDNEDDNQALYKVMEPTVTGKCETNYDISRVPAYLAQAYPEYEKALPEHKNEQFYEVFKTKNYSNCEQRMGYHFGVNGLNDWTPNTNQMGSLSKSAVSRVVISGSYDKYTIRSSVTTNRVVKANPEKENQHDSEVVSQVNVTLDSMVETQAKPQKPATQLVDAGNLVYSYDLPSDKKNAVRPKHDSSEEKDDENDATKYSGLLSNYANDEQADEDYERRERREHRRQHAHSKNHLSKTDEYERRDNDNEEETRKQYQQPKPTLKYAPEDPLSAYFVGNNGKSIQTAKNFNGPAEAQKLAQEIAADLENVSEIPVKHTLRKFNILAKVLRTMNAEQIEQTTRQIEEQTQQGEKKQYRVYADALASAGTGPAVNELMSLIEQRKIKGETAAELIATLPKTIRQPTEEMQQRFFDFVKNDAVKNQATVNTTAGFALTRFLSLSHDRSQYAKKFYPVDTYGRLTDRDSELVSQKVIPYFAKELENAVREKDAPTILYAIRALGNLGHSEVPRAFEPYLSGKERVTDFQRLAIVLALDRYAQHYPKTAQTILFQLYQNKGETHEIRTAAVFQLMRTKPSADLLQRMAEETNNEENHDVRAAVRAAIESAAELKDPKHAELARNAKSAKNLLKKEEQGVQYSRTYLRDYAVAEMEASFEQQYSYINGRDSFIPKGVFLQSFSNQGGFKNSAEFQAVVSSIEELSEALSDNDQKDNNKNQEWNKEQQEQSKWSAEYIMKLLNMKPNQSKQLEGQIFMKILNNERYMTFDKQTLEQMMKNAKELARELRQGKQIQYTKLYNQEDETISFPLETGIPFVYAHRMPTLVQVNGNIKATYEHANQEQNDKEERTFEKMNLEADIDAVYSVNNEVSLSFVNPSTRQRYTVGYDKKAQLNVPVRVSSRVDFNKREIQTEFKPLYADKQTKFLQMGSWPYTTRDNVMDLRPMPESKHTKDIHSRPKRESNYRFADQETGYAVIVKGTQENGSELLDEILKQVRKQGMGSLAWLSQQSYSPKHYSINVILDAAQSTTKSTKITINYDNTEYKQQQQQYNEARHPRARGQSADGSENLAIPESTAANSQQRRDQYLRNAAEGFTAPTTAGVYDISVEFQGPKNLEYIATVATASSKPDGKSRVLVFVQKSETNDQKKSLMIQVDAKHHTVDRHEKPHAEYKINADVALDGQIELANLRGKIEMKQSKQLNDYMKYESRQQEQWNQNAIDEITAELQWKGIEAHILLKKLRESKLYNYVRYIFGQYLTRQQEHKGQKDKVSVEVRLHPDTKLADVQLQTPEQKMEWNDIALPKMTKYVAAVPTAWNLKEAVKRNAIQRRDSCSIHNNEVRTFERRQVKHDKNGNTWYLAVHKMHESDKHEQNDKKQKHYVSVLVRNAKQSDNEDQQQEQQRKEALIVLHPKGEKHITIRLSPSQQHGQRNAIPRVYVDEQEQQVHAEKEIEIRHPKKEQTLARAYLVKENQQGSDEPKHILHFESKLGQLAVKYDGQRVHLHSQGMMRNNRGICGAYTGQQTNELKSPDNKIMRNDNEFVNSWAIVDETSNPSSALKQMQYRLQQAQSPSEEVLYSRPIQMKRNDDYENDDSEERQQQYSSSNKNKNQKKTETKHQTQYVEDKENQRICFSKRPLPVCASGTKANGKVIQHVEVHCRDINDAAAQQYKSQIQRGRSLDLSSYKANAKLTFSVPRRCEQA